MSSNYFPAAQPYLAPDPMAQVAKLLELRNQIAQAQYQQQVRPLQLEQQRAQTAMEQQNLQDMQLSTQALQQSNGDPEDYLKRLREGGVSWKAYSQVQSAVLDYQLKQENKQKIQLENEASTFDRVASQMAVVKDNLQTNPQLATQAWDRGLTMAEQGQLIQPGQISHQLPSNVNDVGTALNLLGFHKAITQDALDQAKIPGETARSQLSVADNAAYQNWKQIPGNEFKSIDDYKQERGVSEEVAKTAAVQPYKLAQVRAEAGVHAYYQNQLFNQRDAYTKVESMALAPYNTTMSKIAEAKDAITQAQQTGNIVAARAAVAKLAGVEMPAGAGRMASKLYDQQFGSLPTQWASKLKGMFTGDQWTPQMSQDALSYIDSVGSTATQNANRTIGQISSLHRVPISPLQYQSAAGAGGGAAPGAPQLPPQARSQLKEGQVTTFRNGQQWTLQGGQPVQVK